ncbi:MAG: PQQ-binding-like beta-propeller repeat protein [Synergistaceae bacterium]|jgi:outer membrane protein assembly factor BamB|nr:PQQ-binding-like beta-propeller repeat protein [Synergistaceae bacterium]
MKRLTSVFFLTALWIVIFHVPSVSAWSGKLGWTYEAEYPIGSSVAVAEGLVLAGDNAGNLHAVHAASGKAAWIYRGSNSVVGQPTILDQKVIFAQADGTITALSLSKGTLLWKYAPPEESYAADTVVDGTTAGDGKVFFVKGDGQMVALSAENGKMLWTYGTGQELRSAPYFSEGIVFLGEQRGVFSAVNPKTGKRDWGGGAGGAINTPMTEGGCVYFSSWDGSVQSVKIKGVIPQWKTDVGDPVTTPPSVERGGAGGEKIFVGTANGKVAALSKADGSMIWSFDTQGGTVVGTPIAAEGLVFIGGGQGTLFVLDAKDGAVRFTFSTGGGINGTPAFSGGVLFLGSTDGNLYAIR